MNQSDLNPSQESLQDLTIKLNETAALTSGSQQVTQQTPNVSRLLKLCKFASLLESLPFNSVTNANVATSQHLNFDARPRINVLCPVSPHIHVHNSKTLPEGVKWYVICTYKRYTQGLESNMTYKNRLLLMKAIIKMISYHNGYLKPPVNEKTVAKYLVRYRQAIRTGVSVGSIFKSVNSHSKVGYVASIQAKYPDFLHKLFCYAVKILGLNATVPQIVETMNEQATIRHPHCPVCGQLQMTIYKFWNFFYSNGGKLKQSTEKPTLTPRINYNVSFLLAGGLEC